MIDFQKIGKYEVTAKLGQGSFGVVYQGRDAYLKRDVAIKVCSVEDIGLRKRFLREAEIAGKLVHKNIVTVYEFGFEGEIPFLVQELLSGEDLSRMVKRRAEAAVADKLDILLQVAGGLGYAHTEGVIHRDIKPANIRVLGDGAIKIMDFGIAKLASAETQLTQKGVTMGSASYLPPEQIRGSDVDHRADIFSFGVLAHELLTFERPFRGNTLSALVYQILYKVPPPMTSVWDECPEALSDLVGRCLEKKPDRRFGSFSELIPRLTEIRNEVAAGKWPALVGMAVPDPPTAGVVQEPSDVLDPGEITRTAKGVLEGKIGEYTISTVVPAQEALRPPESENTGRTTRPIEAVAPPARPAETVTPSAVAPPEATIRIETPPQPAADEALKTRIMPTLPDLEAPDLASTAHEISRLVAEGHLEAAKEQLEATMTRQDFTGIQTALDTPIAEEPPPDADDGRQDTREIQLDQETLGAVEQAVAETKTEVPAATTAVPEIPTAPETAAPETVPLETQPIDPARSDTYRTFLRPPLGTIKWLGVPAAVVLVVGLGWLLLGGGEEIPPEPVVEEPAPPPAVAPAAAPEPVLGMLAVNAVPWAEVTEITDAQGYLKELPEVAQTPLYLELPPGQYKIHLRHPDNEEIQTCDLEVTLDEVASCTQAFGETRVEDYFKESGWWQ
ncbi:MAG: protein kinase [bacterium]|nr:protein kinase [bacterium]